MSSTVVEIAHAAVLEVADASEVGSHIQTRNVGETVVVEFASLHPGYVGWHWSVALSGSPYGVDEVWQEPGETSLVAAPWVPWSERIQPGDLQPGDVFPTKADDPGLLPGYTGSDEIDELLEPLTPQAWSVGLGRERVLSPIGIDDAVDRWREGESGPRTAHARYAENPCSTCGWLLTIGGRLGQAFGVCANAMSPSDGRIVAMDHGCGAHSETVVEVAVTEVAPLVIDEFGHEPVDRQELAALEVEIESDLEESEESEIDALATESDQVVELDESHVEDQSDPEQNQL